MEKVTDLNRTELLIDFNSPVSKRLLDSPLIPIPLPPRQSISVSPVNSNPFDVVERQIAPSDPFECAFESAYKNESHGQNIEEYIQTPKTGTVKSNYEKNNICSAVNVEKTDGTPTLLCVENISALTKKGIPQHVENEESCFQLLSAKSASISVVVSEADSQSYVSTDISTEEGLRAVIAKRVNKCIQKVLNNTLKSKLSQSNENLHRNEMAAKNNVNRRSLSFIIDSKKDIKSDRLNKSCADSSSNNGPFFENNQLQSPDESSLGLCNMELLNLTSEEVCKTGDSILLPSENELVFHEAKKLARTFSKIADSFCQDIGSDNEDDLMSIKPRWLDSSSEDEEEKLRKDPALNIRVKLTPVVPSQSDSTALTAYKSRARQSMSPPQSQKALQDEADSGVKTKSRVSFPLARRSKPAAPPKVPSIASVPVPANLVNPETKSIRLKKSNTADTKRGPMRAVMPIQSMTKELLNSQGKALANCNISPVRLESALQSTETPKLEKCQMRMRPVASSTPNKMEFTVDSPLQPPVTMFVSKRRSLGDEVTRKSRTPEISAGSIQRSSSLKLVNSKIPAPGGPRGNSSLTLKSTSNLQRNTSFASPKRAVLGQDKNTNSKTSFNPRALNEVKPKPSPKNGHIKGTMHALSSLIKGKSKKSAQQEKENRFPL